MLDPLSQIPLGALRAFEAAARLLSFTRAAGELGVSQAAVSWQIKALEERLGQPLFVRRTRELTLTEAGLRLSRAASEAMTILRMALADLAERDQSVLAITSLPSLATQWLAPRLGAFQVSNPKVAVRLDSSSRTSDLRREGFDLALRGGHGRWPDLVVHRLFPHIETPLCSPETLKHLGGLGRPEDLLAAPRIGDPGEWAHWFRAAGVTPPESDDGLSFNADAQNLEVAAAAAVLGVALGSPILFSADIASGRLVQPFDIAPDYGGGYWLVYPPEHARAAKVTAFRDWLLAEVAADPVIARYAAP